MLLRIQRRGNQTREVGIAMKRMCKWDKKDLKKDFPAFVRQVEDAKHVCEKCLRVANTKKVLCDPLSLKKQSEKS